MPGPYIHMSAMRHAAQALARGAYRPVPSQRIDPGWSGPNPQALGRLMLPGTGKPNFAAVGALGPDLFIFVPDFRDENGVVVSNVLIQVLNFLEKAYAALDPYVTKYEKYLGPLSEDTAEEMSRLTGGLSEIVGDILGDLSSILITVLEDFVSEQSDWLSFFSLGMNKGYDEQAYFWSDMLHYRETGAFGRALWRAADSAGDDGARSYALGYITHIATDVTGHAFVNAIAGGPYRLHWQRHHLAENHMESYWYQLDPLRPGSASQYPQWTESALYYDIAFAEEDDGPVTRPAYPTGGTLRENWARKRLLDIDSELPDSVAGALLAAIEEVFYQGRPHPKILRAGDGRPTADLIKQAYDLFFRYLKLTSVDGFSHEPPPPPDVFPNLDFPTMNDAQDSPPDDGGGGDGGSFWDDLLDFILSVINVIGWLLEVAVYLATLPWAILADLITYWGRLAAYYAFELPLYHLLRLVRSVLAMTGYAMPMADEISMSLTHVGLPDPQTWHLVIADVVDIFGAIDLTEPPPPGETTFRDRLYPHYHPDDEFRHPWSYPTSHEEWMFPGPGEGTTAAPHAVGTGAETLFSPQDATPDLRDAFETSSTPQQTDSVGQQQVTPDHHLGSAVSFAKYLLWLETRDPVQGGGETATNVPVVPWNLDADRGYAYHGWDWNRNPQAQPVEDPEGNPYQPPCTWPQQVSPDDGTWNENVPLQLHFVDDGLTDPGCLSSTTIEVIGRAARPAPSPAPGRRAAPVPRRSGRPPRRAPAPDREPGGQPSGGQP
jgi:hypothetical protein